MAGLIMDGGWISVWFHAHLNSVLHRLFFYDMSYSMLWLVKLLWLWPPANTLTSMFHLRPHMPDYKKDCSTSTSRMRHRPPAASSSHC